MAYKEFLQTLTYYILHSNNSQESKYKQTNKNKWFTPGICKSSEKLKFPSGYLKERNVSTEFINYCSNYEQIYHKTINLTKKCKYFLIFLRKFNERFVIVILATDL